MFFCIYGQTFVPYKLHLVFVGILKTRFLKLSVLYWWSNHLRAQSKNLRPAMCFFARKAQKLILKLVFAVQTTIRLLIQWILFTSALILLIYICFGQNSTFLMVTTFFTTTTCQKLFLYSAAYEKFFLEKLDRYLILKFNYFFILKFWNI